MEMTCRRLLYLVSTVPSGSRVTSRIIRSMMQRTGALYTQYKKLADQETDVIFGGRLGEYKYYDMDAVVASALAMSKRELRL